MTDETKTFEFDPLPGGVPASQETPAKPKRSGTKPAKSEHKKRGPRRVQPNAVTISSDGPGATAIPKITSGEISESTKPERKKRQPNVDFPVEFGFIKQMMELMDADEDTARAAIEKQDHERAQMVRDLFNRDLANPLDFDCTWNMGTVSHPFVAATTIQLLTDKARRRRHP